LIQKSQQVIQSIKRLGL